MKKTPRDLPQVVLNDNDDPEEEFYKSTQRKRISMASTVYSRTSVFKAAIKEISAQSSGDIDNEQDYDTDIEIKGKSLPEYDAYGAYVYNSCCSKMKLRPLTQIIKALATSRIVVEGQGLTWRDALAISYSLLENVCVGAVNLNGNKINSKGAHYIGCMLAENTCITSLSLANNCIANDGFLSIADSLTVNPCLTHLNISGTELDDDVAMAISNLLKINKILTKLNLSHNDLTDIGAKYIGQALAENDYLKDLDISWNKIRPVGVMYIFNGLQQNASLNRINVGMNGVDFLGAKTAAEMLKSNRCLKDLNLTNCRVTDKGLALIAKALSENDCLEILRIPQNSITASGAALLADYLKKNESSSLTYIDMSTTHVLQDFMDDIEELKAILPNIRVEVGGIVSTYHCTDSEKEGNIHNKNPLTLLRWYVASKSLRLIDLFRQFDKDNSMTVSREEFVEGLNNINMQLTEVQLERLIKMLDKDGDGEVDYGELVEGDKMHRRKLRKLRGSLQNQQQQAVERLLAIQQNAQQNVSPRASTVQREPDEDIPEVQPKRKISQQPGRKISTIIPPKRSDLN